MTEQPLGVKVASIIQDLAPIKRFKPTSDEPDWKEKVAREHR